MIGDCFLTMGTVVRIVRDADGEVDATPNFPASAPGEPPATAALSPAQTATIGVRVQLACDNAMGGDLNAVAPQRFSFQRRRPLIARCWAYTPLASLTRCASAKASRPVTAGGV